jgi:hypothetical protein
MGAGIWVAVVTSATSLVVAVATLSFQHRQFRKEQEEKKRSDAKVVLDKYRGPLLASAWELGDRIDNIRDHDFLTYIESLDNRSRDAKLTTLFRFAQYLGWHEILRTEVQLLRFEHEHDTLLTDRLMNDIIRALATDKVSDRTGGMLWAEEQRAIGELMVLDGKYGSSTCRGYANFAQDYDDVFSPWMERVGHYILSDAALTSHRLGLLEMALYGLIMQLDEKNSSVGDDRTDHAKEALELPEMPEAPSIETSIRKNVRLAQDF